MRTFDDQFRPFFNSLPVPHEDLVVNPNALRSARAFRSWRWKLGLLGLWGNVCMTSFCVKLIGAYDLPKEPRNNPLVSDSVLQYRSLLLHICVGTEMVKEPMILTTDLGIDHES